MGIPNALIFNKILINKVAVNDAHNEYAIIIGFPTNRGTKIDFKIDITSADGVPTATIANIITIFEKPTLIKGSVGIIAGIKFSITPIINESASNIAV